MPELWRPKLYSDLSPKLLQEKLRRDAEYEIAHLNLTADLKAGRITQAEFEAAHAKQWNEYEAWAKVSGLYEQITPEQQLAEAEDALAAQVEAVNRRRAKLKKPLIETREKRA